MTSIHTFQNYYKVMFPQSQSEMAGEYAPIRNGYQEVTVNVSDTGYKPNVKNIKAGVPVKLKLVTDNVRTCARAFTIPSLNLSKILPLSGEEEVTFTPTKTGSLLLSCSMGMYYDDSITVKE